MFDVCVFMVYFIYLNIFCRFDLSKGLHMLIVLKCLWAFDRKSETRMTSSILKHTKKVKKNTIYYYYNKHNMQIFGVGPVFKM